MNFFLFVSIPRCFNKKNRGHVVFRAKLHTRSNRKRSERFDRLKILIVIVTSLEEVHLEHVYLLYADNAIIVVTKEHAFLRYPYYAQTAVMPRNTCESR